jgi:3-deoxy-D-manno-octulosonate 8-phosphate phosphatase (KDO 8-P phosphatase)
MNDYRERLKHISTLIFDYDGVLSDGKILFTENGEQLRNGNVKDGYAIQLAKKMGYRLAVISGGNSNGMKTRCELLQLSHYFLGVHDKIKLYETFKKEYNLNDAEILFMGDDIPDYPLMQKAGISSCPANAAKELREIAHYISPMNGGDGCVRDVIEQVLRAQNNWMTPQAFIW